MKCALIGSCYSVAIFLFRFSNFSISVFAFVISTVVILVVLKHLMGSSTLKPYRNKAKSYVLGSEIPLFPYNRGWSLTQHVGVYIPIIQNSY